MNKMISFSNLIDLEPKPKKVKLDNQIFEWTGFRYKKNGTNITHFLDMEDMKEPNIEIIEEDLCEKCENGTKEFLSDYPNLCYQCAKEFYKIEEDKDLIEKITPFVLCDSDFSKLGQHSLNATEIISKSFEETANKINEIIDYINKKEKGSDE